METKTVGVGDHVPEVAFPRLDGGEVSLAALRGKKTLLFFWGSW